jgi:hypothetical protein
MADSDERNGSQAAQVEWLDQVDALLARAGMLTEAARSGDAPLAERIGLLVEIIAVRQRLQARRAALLAGASVRGATGSSGSK